MTYLTSFPKWILPKIPEYTFTKNFVNLIQNSYSVLETRNYVLERDVPSFDSQNSKKPPIKVQEDIYKFLSFGLKNIGISHVSFEYGEKFHSPKQDVKYQNTKLQFSFLNYRYHIKETISIPVIENECKNCIPCRYQVTLTEVDKGIVEYKNREDGCGFAILLCGDVPKDIYRIYKETEKNIIIFTT
jgi:hypothetical protein